MALTADDVRGGIYCFRNTVSGRRYVGQSVNLIKRRRHHTDALRRGTHFNDRLQKSYNKHGEACFVFQVVEYCAPHNLTQREQFWIDRFGFHNLYNLRPYADSSQKGYKHSARSRAAMSAAHKGKPLSLAHRMAFVGRKHTAATRAAISKALSNRVWKPQTNAKLSDSITKWHAAMPLEQRQRMLASLARMRLKLIGRVRSADEMARRSEALKAAHARRREST